MPIIIFLKLLHESLLSFNGVQQAGITIDLRIQRAIIIILRAATVEQLLPGIDLLDIRKFYFTLKLDCFVYLVP